MLDVWRKDSADSLRHNETNYCAAMPDWRKSSCGSWLVRLLGRTGRAHSKNSRPSGVLTSENTVVIQKWRIPNTRNDFSSKCKAGIRIQARSARCPPQSRIRRAAIIAHCPSKAPGSEKTLQHQQPSRALQTSSATGCSPQPLPNQHTLDAQLFCALIGARRDRAPPHFETPAPAPASSRCTAASTAQNFLSPRASAPLSNESHRHTLHSRARDTAPPFSTR